MQTVSVDKASRREVGVDDDDEDEKRATLAGFRKERAFCFRRRSRVAGGYGSRGGG